jgi:myo-inositol 2-dehydrogenase/D-chiro-inositol 1-dehydrogenase
MVADIRYGFIGTGSMGREHINNVLALDGAKPVAAFDPDPESTALAVKEAGEAGIATHATIDDLLGRDDLDAVVVSSPNFTHREVLERVFATELHVLVEKPLCTTIPDCVAVADAAAERRAITWMGLEYRYMPAVDAVVHRVAGGAVGDVRMVAVREHRHPFLRKVGDWNRFRRYTGGTLVEKCCHFFHLMNLLAPGRPVRVIASGAQDVNHLEEVYAGEVPDILDNAFVIVEYDSGARAMLDLCMFAEGSRWEQEISVTGDAGKIQADVPGLIQVSRGAEAEVTVGSRGPEWPVHTRPAPLGDSVAHAGDHHGASFVENRLFCDAIRSGAPPEVTLGDGLRSVAIGVAAHRSIDEGRPVQLAELEIPDRYWR